MGAAIHREICVTNETENLHKVREFVSAAVQDSAVPREEQNKVILAVDEAVANVMEHAYEGTLGGSIRVRIESDERRFEVLIRDHGRRFDPGRIVDPDIEAHVRAGRKNGLGVFLMRQIMDKVDYDFRDEAENRLTLVKFLGADR
ncbi:MAG: ATP-binding protein [Planctomycetes bacterium]|nr:ATP-binding protein [Planctomycetota bacterium]